MSDQQKLLELKKTNLMSALSHQEPNYVPNMITGGAATIEWTGQRIDDLIMDPPKFLKAVTAVFEEMWVDGNILLYNLHSNKLEQAFDHLQTKFAADGITVEHVQNSLMKAEEYDQLIENPSNYIYEVILPRKFPEIFEDREKAKKSLKLFAEDRVYTFIQLITMTNQYLADNYGVFSLLDLQEMFATPLDMIFDHFRGFQGTLTDIRRYPQKVRDAINKLWEVSSIPDLQRPLASTYALQMPHIPAYLTPKQYEELYWPHQKKFIERMADGGGKSFILLQGRWEKIWHHFLELPKDSCILGIDDDSIFEAKKILGDHHIIAGGLDSASTRLKKFDQIKDDIKRVIDTCAPGGGFLFSSNKYWYASGDVNQNLIDSYNFAHEYSKK